MGPAVLFFLMLVAAAPLHLAAQTLNDSMAKPSTVWINNGLLLRHGYSGIRTIITCSLQPQTQGPPDVKLHYAVGFICVSSQSSQSPCSDFLFAVFVYINTSISINATDLEPRVVWSANQAHPVRENATLEFTLDGNLVLRDDDGNHVWSSSSSSRFVIGMVITEIGNLMLFDQRNAMVWQSFDHPTDTLLLGQSLQEGMRLTASTSTTNMIKNQFYIIVLPDRLCAYVESTPPKPYYCKYWMTDNKRGNDPINVTFMNASLTFFVQSEIYDRILLPAAKSTQYMRLDLDGHLRLYEWSIETWKMKYEVIGISDCAYQTDCGEYSICTTGHCTCIHENYFSSTYFRLVNERRPSLGCTPVTPISCQEIRHHQLLALTDDIPYFDDSHMVVNTTNKDECKRACLENCSCRAVMFSYDQLGHSICVWMTKVFSLQAIQPTTNLGYEKYSTAYLKVQLSHSISASTSNKTMIILGVAFGAIATLAFLAIMITIYLQQRRKNEDKGDEYDFNHFPGMPARFSLEKLRECTEGFGKKLGEGGFGSVFEGKLGEERVAVKRLEGASQGKKEFLAEVETIGNIEHINIVSLIGFCAEKSQRLLVYEYMPRGSLDRWIYYRQNSDPLDWYIRCRIILDIAKGLCYLHEECRRKIAHLDIKPQNILLDDNFNAKVADFGLCKLINRDQSKVVTVMRGTPGYLAPEWLTSRITEKVDVYSFGVVVMEIVSGRKNIDNSQAEEEVQLIHILREKEQNNQLIDLIDKHNGDMVSHQEEVIQMMKLAVWCLQNDSTRRPSMSTVIKVLEGSVSVETFDANSIMLVQDNLSTYSGPSQASILSGPR
ncbi:G-type lectin S-receptor-like serine/threonine-protein kinase SD2-5 [Triticum urartu]|uniref:Receptor-like serine/threonine-protein kinase n=2 Tax=Triticum urartu TaxID=4572 RepID=M8AUM9_TRIUA|nr:G-type lectin S-receptor-like serine/threonine-protein kinase SD2-5 [Triticum urartu]EMS64724.1 G-type lectin S-receptor-like serine/threonine-protein kinase SD2-5 [Triticum urartu]